MVSDSFDDAKNFENNADIHSLYSRELARFKFEPVGKFAEALSGLYGKESAMGGQALALYSDAQEFYHRVSTDHSSSEKLASAVERRTRHLHTKQFKVARYVLPRLESAETGFQFSVFLDAATQEQMHACVHDGLDQRLFGRKKLEATLWVPNSDLIEKNKRKEVSASIRDAIYGDDNPSYPMNELVVPENPSFVSGLRWSRSTTSRH